MIKILTTIILAGFLGACSGGGLGGTEFGNPTRELTGTVIATTPAALIKSVVSCPADTAIITDAAGGTVSADLAGDCSFSMDAPTGKSYLLSFVSGGSFIANMIFARDSSNVETTIFHVSTGSSAVDLGEITLNGSRATPARNPLTQNDRDDNGVSDFDDDDDDGDGIDDDSEEDCDFDGFWDDDDACESDDDNNDSNNDDNGDDEGPTGATVEVLQIYPFNGDTFVSLDEEVRIQTNCIIDETTLTEALTVLSATDEEVVCDFSLENSDTRLKCEHEINFEPETAYSVTLDGLFCENGDPIESIDWAFETGAEQDDDDDHL